MTLPSFDYAAPVTVSEAVALLAASGGTAMLLAGGQSLMPLLAFRLAHPSLLVDLRRIPGLAEITVTPSGLSLGARVRWRDIADDGRMSVVHPLLAAAVGHVAHYQIRNRGTVGGSLAHADPAAELPGIAVTCDAEIAVIGPSGDRIVPAGSFFVGALSTVLARDELITGLHLPTWPPRRRWGFQEIARRRGDFAIAGITLFYDEDPQGRVMNAHVGVIGAASQPHRLLPVEVELNGRVIDERTIAAAANAAQDTVRPPDDIHASGAYRRALVATLVERTLVEASLRPTPEGESA